MTTKLSDLFAKPIDRPIEGVIKADDLASLRLEVEEYVITNEVAQRLETFFDAYNNYQGANGVWISGFFGSGKSHLLKMLALLLENREIDGAPALDYFLPKCEGNAVLAGQMRQAVAVPARSILFNIDQKADTISKAETDALLSVFVKVFNEMCGYYGKQGYIARFERHLDKRGMLDAFKQAFQEEAGIPWERGREQITLEKRNVDRAYARISGEPPESAGGIIDHYRHDYKMSIEDFAELVNDYIQNQPPGFRLNFFVDEVGQYIADNVKLMTNLQTIAESLATRCQGRAWIVVTAQEDMHTVLGEMSKQQSNDFTKIQARFLTRMKLTSANVDEVIQERLLKKNEMGRRYLAPIYAAQKNNFGTLFEFTEGIRYRGYRDEDDFIAKYPFVPYQFTLFQAAIENLSIHNAFEGRHSSVGERSMLGVFQEVVKTIAEQPPGVLATFDRMFEGLRTVLKSQIQRAIINAETHLNDPFAVQVLKALFLVKYVKSFKATPHNLRILLQSSFDEDLAALQERIQAALTLLEQQTYIQRLGDKYMYLTDEEKDVEQEIKATQVDDADLLQLLDEGFFSGIVRDRKIRFDKTKQDFPFAHKVDDRLSGRDQELTIHLVTPFHEHADNLDLLRANALGRAELTVVLPADDRLLRDVTLYKQTEKYLRQHQAAAASESIRRIVADKSVQNENRRRDIQARLTELVSQARILVAGEEFAAASSDPRSRILEGFTALVERTYPNLRMIYAVQYDEGQIGALLRANTHTLLSNDADTLTEAEQEVLTFVQQNQASGLRTTVKSVVDKFEKKPYGWYLAAIQCVLAKLCAAGKLEARQDGVLLEDTALENALRNTQDHAQVILDRQAAFSPGQIKRLGRFYQEFFDRPPEATEARALGKETKEAFARLEQELEKLLQQKRDYPFLSALEPPLASVRLLAGQPYSFFLTELPQQADQLLAWKEERIDPIRRFLAGEQKQIYDRAAAFLQRQRDNFSLLDDQNSVMELQSILDAPDCYRNNQMTRAKTLVDGLEQALASRLETLRQSTLAEIRDLEERVTGTKDFQALTPDRQTWIRDVFRQVRDDLQTQNVAGLIRDRMRRFRDEEYGRLLAVMTAGQTSKEPSAPGEKAVAETPIRFTPLTHILPPFAKLCLEDESDVDAYLQALKEKILEEIRSGKRIQLP